MTKKSFKSKSRTVLVDKTIQTEYGELVMKVYLEEILSDIDKFTSMLKTVRGIPFNMSVIGSSDPMTLLAAKEMPWATPERVSESVRSHWESITEDAKDHAKVLALTKRTPKMDFDPEPWEEDEAEEWEFQLPKPYLDISEPTERRLKQIYDMIGSDPDVFRQVMSTVNTMFIEAERRAADVDSNGFRNGKPSRDVHQEVVSGSKKYGGEPASGLGRVHEGDEDPQSGQADEQS